MKNLAVISHDAGGAELLSHWLKNNDKKYNYSLVLKGPAKKVFRDNNIALQNNDLKEVIEKSKVVITSTSCSLFRETSYSFIKKNG